MGGVILEQVEVVLPRLPRGLDGMSILHVSDVHANRRFARRGKSALALIRDLHPDLIVCTGDTVNSTRWWPVAETFLSALPSGPPRLAVPGNWDYRNGGGRVPFEASMTAAGFLPLLNRSVHFPCRGTTVQVAGFDDIRYGAFDPDQALNGLDPNAFILGLCHNPDLLLHVDASVIDLLLAGHTHGGQILLPRVGAVIVSTHIGTAYASGLFETSPGRSLYVSRGLGEGIFPWRLGCPPELTVLRLRALLDSGNALG